MKRLVAKMEFVMKEVTWDEVGQVDREAVRWNRMVESLNFISSTKKSKRVNFLKKEQSGSELCRR